MKAGLQIYSKAQLQSLFFVQQIIWLLEKSSIFSISNMRKWNEIYSRLRHSLKHFSAFILLWTVIHPLLVKYNKYNASLGLVQSNHNHCLTFHFVLIDIDFLTFMSYKPCNKNFKKKCLKSFSLYAMKKKHMKVNIFHFFSLFLLFVINTFSILLFHWLLFEYGKLVFIKSLSLHYKMCQSFCMNTEGHQWFLSLYICRIQGCLFSSVGWATNSLKGNFRCLGFISLSVHLLLFALLSRHK